MPHGPAREVLGEVFCSVLQQITSMCGEAVPREECPVDDCPYVKASLSFKGPVSGSLDLVVPAELCPEIAANQWGVDGDDEVAYRGGLTSLREVILLTCAHVLKALLGDGSAFELGWPRTAELDRVGFQTLLDRPGTESFMVEGAPVLLRLALIVQ